eukprot:Seg3149.1_Seg3149.2 transcript_id=Seg3149.1_Seg3149.2/GoldUCD/mRNA.D3Y31 product="NACHT LRR and PYD domains-containing protein 3" protein_id=Seg3149.1_Seg3149.2/GoldUCD/D3Y31
MMSSIAGSVLVEEKLEDIEVKTIEQGATMCQHTEVLSQLSTARAGLEMKTNEQGATIDEHTKVLSQLHTDLAGLEVKSSEHTDSVTTLQEESKKHSEALADLSQQVKFRRDKEDNSVKVICKRQDDMAEKFTESEQRFAVIGKRQDDMEEKFSEIEQKSTGVRKRVDVMERDLKCIQEPKRSPVTNINIFGGNVLIGDGGKIHEEDRLQSSSEDLKDKYKRRYQKHTITCVENTELDQKHVDLDKFAVDVTVLKGHKVASLPNERSEFISKLHDIRSQRSVELNELVDRESEERVSFVRGLAGIGKTVLAKQIALKWANGIIFREFTHVYVLECRNLNGETSLDDLLKREFFGDSAPKGNNLLFIIDGVDEVDDLETKLKPKGKQSIIYQLLDKSSHRYNESKVILLGRPHVQTTLKSREGIDLIGNMKTFEMIGLSEKSVSKYINLFTEKESQKEEAIQKTRDSSQNISVLMSIPQYLNTLCCVAILTEGKAISNTTELYTWLLFLFFKSHIKDVDDVTEIFSNYFDFIKTFGKISYELLLKKTIVFKQKDFTEELKELTDNEEVKNIFNVFCIKVGGIQTVQKYQFKHLTLQEFFGSLYCLIAGIKPDELIQNDNFEIVSFICGFYGGMLKNQGEDEESIIDIVCECLKSEGKEEDDEGTFLFGVLKALNDEVEEDEDRLERALICSAEYLNPKFQYCNNELIEEIIKKVIRFMPHDEYSKGRASFDSSSSIAQLNVEKLLDIAKRNGLLEEFKNVYLHPSSLYDFGLCKYFKYFGRVSVIVCNPVYVDKFNSFFRNCIYCNEVELRNCKIVGDGFGLRDFNEGLETKEEHSRLEELTLREFEIDEGNWRDVINIIAKIKRVRLWNIEVKASEWIKLVDAIEENERVGRLKLERLIFGDCNIDYQLKERIKEAGVEVLKFGG